MRNNTIRRMMVVWQSVSYRQQMLNLFGDSIIRYWTLGDRSGTTATDASKNAGHGTYTNVTLGQGGIGDGQSSAYFGGTGYVDVYSAALASAFNTSEGTIILWAKVPAAQWANTTNYCLVHFGVDTTTNYIRIMKVSAIGTLGWSYMAGSDNSYQGEGGYSAYTDWICVAITWSKSGDKMQAYFNGVKDRAGITGLGDWSGALSSTRCVIGAQTKTPALPNTGNEQHVILLNRAATHEEIRKAARLPIGQFGAPTNGGFTVVFIPDSQVYNTSYAWIQTAIANWIVAQKTNLNIQMVMHVGDIMSNGSQAGEQTAADAFIDILDAGAVKNLIGIGNHDYDVTGDRTASTGFDAIFPQARFMGQTGWAGGFCEANAHNSYNVVEIGGVNYLFLNLEIGPRQAVVDWANALLTTHADKKVIISTHSFVSMAGHRMTTGDANNPHGLTLGSDCHDGEELWNELIKLHDNILWVHSGHDFIAGSAGEVHLSSNSNGGKAVEQVVTNWQGDLFGGGGHIVLVKFDPVGGTITQEVYSPWDLANKPAFAVPFPP